MSIHDALAEACRAVGIKPPKRQPVPGRWIVTDTESGANGKGDGRVKLDDDGRGGIVWNHQTAQHQRFRDTGLAGQAAAPIKRDPEKERRQQEDQRQVERACAEIVNACQQVRHPYLIRKGFPDELGLVHDAPWRHFPAGWLGEAMGKAIPEGEGPFLVVPGRVGGKLTTVQFITPEGAKKNILRGIMGGASHRIAVGRETWVCEGIATALSVRAALRLLGRSATVLSAFSAANVAKVAAGISGAVIAADHDKPIETLDGLGAGEFYARKSGARWIMPTVRGDWNDLHQAEGLRAVAMQLRGIGMG